MKFSKVEEKIFVDYANGVWRGFFAKLGLAKLKKYLLYESNQHFFGLAALPRVWLPTPSVLGLAFRSLQQEK